MLCEESIGAPLAVDSYILSGAMAGKGGQNKNSPNHASPDHRSTGSGSVNGEKIKNQDGEVVDGETPNSDPKVKSNISVEKSHQTTRSSKKKNQRNGNILFSSESNSKTSDIQQSVDTYLNTRNLVENNTSSSAFENRDDKKPAQCDQIKDSAVDQVPVAGVVENLLEKARCSASIAFSTLRTSMLYATKATKAWVERQKPSMATLTTAVNKGHAYIRRKTQHAFPIVQTCLLNAGKLVLLLFMVLLDCNIRGFDSLVHLGTTSFFTVLWCSILSIFAMIGIKKMLLLLVVAAAAFAFIGLGFATLIVSVAALVILWVYGSFWTTSLVIFIGGTSFFLRHDRFALLVTTLYSMYCAKSYVGWFGLFLGLDLSFITCDVLTNLLKDNMNERQSDDPSTNADQTQGRTGNFYEDFHVPPADDNFQSGYGRSTDRSPGDPSTSGAEKELTSEDEIIRLLSCSDHYSVLGFHRYENIDVSLLKKEYRKRAMLVHPDKNMGNEKAAEAFKKLQNAYEVLLDSLKHKTYDDELRREELLNYFRRFQSASQKKGRNRTFRPGFGHSDDVDEGPHGHSRRIACKKCGDFHLWTYTGRSKSRARWCQDCKDFHQAKDGDGWVEQSSQPLLFGLLQKADDPRVYVCAESRIFDVTEWFICQGMRSPVNTHKPSFHVNTNLTKQSSSKGGNSAHKGGEMTEEEVFEWLQNAMQSGMFETSGAQNDQPSSPGSGNISSTSNAKKKRKGKKQW